MNGIMDAKRQGEEKLRATIKDYVIIRSGVLLSGKSSTGALGMEVNQGDTIGGGLSRDELAQVAIAALQSGKKGATVEVYRKSTATALEPSFTIPSGKEHVAPTYAGLFDGIELD